MYLETIDGPHDLLALSSEQRVALASEIRRALIHKLSRRGGHVGPNLGFVEATIALHCVFQGPEDKIVFDVSHQSYTHKMLTGRKAAFLDESKYGDVSGYTEPTESDYDLFRTGHTSTSISLASGLAKARDMRHGGGNIIAVIGDGALSGGQAMEGLDYVGGELDSNMIIVVNDNGMSIAENHGGLYRSLARLRESNGTSPANPFTALGLDYRYVEKGNDIDALIEAFESVKDIDHPVVVHIHTRKGKGYGPAERDQEGWHWHAAFDEKTGEALRPSRCTYLTETGDQLLRMMRRDPEVTGIIAATPTVFDFTPDRRAQAGRQLVDVGIAEEQAVSMASGMAKAGGKPVVGMYSSFLERTYDQMMQDVCMNGSPATFCIGNASIWGWNDVTHLGLFDIAMIGNIPGLTYLAPTTVEELDAMMDWAVAQTAGPVAIRIPAGEIRHSGNRPVRTDYSQTNRFEVTHQGSGVAVIAAGDFYHLGEQVAEQLQRTLGVDSTLINPLFVSGIDSQLLASLQRDHQVVVTLEDGILSGGFGQKVAAFYGNAPMRVLTYGFAKEFIDRFDPAEVMRRNGLEPVAIVRDVARALHDGDGAQGVDAQHTQRAVGNASNGVASHTVAAA
ncbi:MAG: 1-deoxy-D-xylulose-5-phosphate synthase [Bifidobacteriaceae bacterium]|nr:1-deoxy-D-xylulose-5-phosphate synthase [Bifidobacteriaceae bacterium]